MCDVFGGELDRTGGGNQCAQFDRPPTDQFQKFKKDELCFWFKNQTAHENSDMLYWNGQKRDLSKGGRQGREIVDPLYINHQICPQWCNEFMRDRTGVAEDASGIGVRLVCFSYPDLQDDLANNFLAMEESRRHVSCLI